IVEKPKGSRKKRKVAGGASGSSLPPKTLRADHGTFGASASTGEKSIDALQGLLERITLPVQVGVTAVATLSFITSSVSLTSEREGGGRTDSVTGPNLHTQHPSERSLVSDPPIMTTVVATMAVADTSSVSVLRAGNEPVHHTLFADSASIGESNPDVGGSFLSCWQASLLKEKDAEIASLKAQLSLKEAEVAKAICLHCQVTTVEAAEVSQTNELNGLKEQKSSLEEEKSVLEIKVVALESVDATKVTEL
ncbi:hypothetical protein Tco_0165378, partial [Tanacetum coccineum]